MRYWQLRFVAWMLGSMLFSILLYGLLGPFALVLWGGAAFAFGAMWAMRETDNG